MELEDIIEETKIENTLLKVKDSHNFDFNLFF